MNEKKGNDVKKKKSIKKIIVICIIVGICGIFFCPLSFQHFLRDKEQMEVGISNPTVVNGKTEIDMKTYTYKEDSKEFEEIANILNEYKYHCSTRTFLGMTATDGGTEGYVLISLKNDMIVLSGSGDVLINKRLYRIGYWQNEKIVQMMNEIKMVIK